MTIVLSKQFPCSFFHVLSTNKNMLVSDTGLPTAANDVLLKIVSSEGQIYTAYFSEDTLIEHVKNKSVEYFYSNEENGGARFKIVRVYDSRTLHEMLSICQEQLSSSEELLLIERATPDAGTLWDLGTVRAPQVSTIAAATASLPAPESTMQQPNLQSLLSTNELTFELKKILISLVEAGARLAAAGRNYETSLKQLIAALEEPKVGPSMPIQIITPEEIACRLNSEKEVEKPEFNNLNRVELLQMFLDKFRDWRRKMAEPPSGEAVATLLDLGFSIDEADEALKATGNSVPAAASYIIGERGSSIFELTDGLPNRSILQSLLKQPQIQRGLLNTRMLVAFISMVGQNGSAALWLNSAHGSPLLTQISRTYHSEKYCLAVNQFAQTSQGPSTSSQRR